MSEGPTSVGSIKGKVDIDVDEALAKLAEVKAATNSLGGRDNKIKIDTKDAVRETDNLERSTKRLGSTMDGVNGAAKRQNDWQAVAVRGLIDISAALPPVAAGAVGVAGALGGMGVAGGLAIAGIARSMKSGQGAGVAYIGMVKNLQTGVHDLQDTAAKGLLPGAEKSTAILTKNFPVLNSMVRQFSGQLGGILPTGLQAVLNLIERANPAFQAGGKLVGDLVDDLDKFSMSAGYGQFIDYTVKNMPQVERLLTQVITLAGDLLAAWAPLGEDTLPILTDLVTGLDDIVKVAKPIIPVIGGIYLAFRGWAAITGIITGITAAMEFLGVTSVATAEKVALAETVATEGGAGSGLLGLFGKGGLGKVATLGKSVLGKAALPIAGTIIGGGAVLNTSGKGANSIYQGLLGGAEMGAGIGTLGGPVGALVGAGVGGTVGSIYGSRNQKPPTSATAAGATYGASWNGYSGAAPSKSTGKAPATGMSGGDTSYGGFGASSTAIDKSTASTKQHTAAAGADYLATIRQGIAARETASNYATLNGTMSAATTAGYLNVTSQNAAQESILAVKDALKQNKGAWSENTAAGLADRDAVASSISAINAHAAAINADGKHAQQATQYTGSHILSLVKEAEAAGISKGAITDYISQLLGVPKSVVTKMLLDAEKAKTQAKNYKTALNDIKNGDYTAALKADVSPAQKASLQGKAFAKEFAKGDYKGILKGDYTPAQKAAATAAAKAKAFATATYQAELKARNGTGPGISAAQRALAALHDKTLNITAVYTSVNASGGNGAQVAKNYAQFGAHGGTTGSSTFGSIKGLAAGGTGGTVRGPGSAATDTAGLYRLANGEEVISNLFGQADRYRPLLKAINSNRLDGSFLDKMTKMARPSITVRTVQPEVHIHNPVAVDPVAQAAEAAQLALAAAGIG